jgi:predicted transcriptional regulator
MRGIRIRPEKDGLKATLFDLEADIMEVVWSRGWAEFSVADVHAELSTWRAIAYTTVMTTVSRLHEKGLLRRERDGRRYVYQPSLDRAGFERAVARDMLGSFQDAPSDTAMALLIEAVDAADTAELDQIEALIRARRAKLGS